MEQITDALRNQHVYDLVTKNGYDVEVGDIICHLIQYMQNKGLIGACHALSSVLYVALSELGLSPVLNIGECNVIGLKPFDHSWITVDGKIIDIAISMPMSVNCFTGPVVFNINIDTMETAGTAYGVHTGLPLSSETLFVLNTSFVEYMSAFPYEANGLWTVVNKILPAKKRVATRKLVKKYNCVERNFVRNEDYHE